LDVIPGFSLRSNPGLRLANAFGVDDELRLANAFGVDDGLKLANAFGVDDELRFATLWAYFQTDYLNT
jgi:predicted outer membrane lipoprotein